jgi:rhodanese-related sulfurtransferase
VTPTTHAIIGAMYPAPNVPEVLADQVPADVLLVDVREDDEWAAGHADGAVHIPLGEVPVRIDELGDPSPDHPFYVICRSGGRSARAVEWLAEHDVPAVNVGGGTKRWAASGRPMVSENGREPRVA